MNASTIGTRSADPPTDLDYLKAPYVYRDDPTWTRAQCLRRAYRAAKFAHSMLREASKDVIRGEAHARVPGWLNRGISVTECSLARLEKDLRRLHSPRMFYWVSWLQGGETPKVLHGEAHTLPEAKEHALQDLMQLAGLHYYLERSELDGAAVVTGPRGARYELRRSYSKRRRFLGFRWSRALPEHLLRLLESQARSKAGSGGS